MEVAEYDLRRRTPEQVLNLAALRADHQLLS